MLPSPEPSYESESDPLAAAAAKGAGRPEAGAPGAVVPTPEAMVWITEAPAGVAPIAAVRAARGAVAGAGAAPRTATGLISSVAQLARCSGNETPCGWARWEDGWVWWPGPGGGGAVGLLSGLNAKQPAHDTDVCRQPEEAYADRFSSGPPWTPFTGLSRHDAPFYNRIS